MNKGKKIEEMKEVIRKGFKRADCHNEYTKEPYPYFDSQITTIAECLYEEHYRNADEVRKETAKEILDEVAKHYGGAWLVELYKKYGIEVDK